MTSALGGSCSVTTLKWISVCAGHEALIIAAVDVSSFSESGASGCVATSLVGRDDGVSATTSVDMLLVCDC
jgi:hypothetical protein